MNKEQVAELFKSAKPITNAPKFEIEKAFNGAKKLEGLSPEDVLSGALNYQTVAYLVCNGSERMVNFCSRQERDAIIGYLSRITDRINITVDKARRRPSLIQNLNTIVRTRARRVSRP